MGLLDLKSSNLASELKIYPTSIMFVVVLVNPNYFIPLALRIFVLKTKTPPRPYPSRSVYPTVPWASHSTKCNRKERDC